MSRFSLSPMPRSTSVEVRHADFPHKAAVALIVPNESGTLSLIPVVTDNPPEPLTGETARFENLGAIADHLGVVWARMAA